MRGFVVTIALLIGLVAGLVAGLAPQAHADDVGDAQTVIRSQVEAFERGDGETAYSHASPTIKGIFAQGDFMAMVKRDYSPIVSHKSFEFGIGRATDGKIEQAAEITDSEGVFWQALYTLERQADGSLKITGCTLKQAGRTA